MATTPLRLDTSPEIEQRQIDAWRQMSPADKAATITALTRAAYALTWAGVRQMPTRCGVLSGCARARTSSTRRPS